MQPRPHKLQRGKYLVSILPCTDCHTPGTFLGRPDTKRYLGGSEVGFEVPGLGIFYGPNLTPDDETGLGKWTKEQIATAIITGKRPDGRILAPPMSVDLFTDVDLGWRKPMDATLGSRVADHYARGDLVEAIREGLARIGKSETTVTADDLAPVDEFHIGGRATDALARQLSLAAEDRVLDIGCGLGGPARQIAAKYGCGVTGIDLTHDYVDAGKCSLWMAAFGGARVVATRQRLGSPLRGWIVRCRLHVARRHEHPR